MPYTDPTPASIKTLFPAFAPVPDDTITAWIGVAKTMVDNTWLETDYTYGVSLYAAYLMTGKGLGTGAEAEIAAGGMSGFNSIRSGQLSLSRGSTSQGGGDVPSPWNTNQYGIEWYWLMLKNRPRAAVTAGGIVGPDGLYPPLGNPAGIFGWGY